MLLLLLLAAIAMRTYYLPSYRQKDTAGQTLFTTLYASRAGPHGLYSPSGHFGSNLFLSTFSTSPHPASGQNQDGRLVKQGLCATESRLGLILYSGDVLKGHVMDFLTWASP